MRLLRLLIHPALVVSCFLIHLVLVLTWVLLYLIMLLLAIIRVSVMSEADYAEPADLETNPVELLSMITNW